MLNKENKEKTLNIKISEFDFSEWIKNGREDDGKKYSFVLHCKQKACFGD